MCLHLLEISCSIKRCLGEKRGLRFVLDNNSLIMSAQYTTQEQKKILGAANPEACKVQNEHWTAWDRTVARTVLELRSAVVRVIFKTAAGKLPHYECQSGPLAFLVLLYPVDISFVASLLKVIHITKAGIWLWHLDISPLLKISFFFSVVNLSLLNSTEAERMLLSMYSN